MRSVARCGHNVLNVRFLCAVDGVYALRRSLWLQWSLQTVFRDRFLSEARSRLPNEVVAELEEAKQVRLAKSLDERARVPAHESPEVGGAMVDRISNLQRLNSRISGPVSHRGGWPRTGTTRVAHPRRSTLRADSP